MKKIDPQLQEKMGKIISNLGYELLGCELLSAGRRSVLRIYIDSPKGVDVEDCSIVSHQVSAMLDVEDPFQGKYTLEVSSPGVDRPLFEKEHYKKYIGSQIKVKLHVAINNRKQYKGILQNVDDEAIYIAVEGLEQIKLPFAMIDKANLIGNVHFH